MNCKPPKAKPVLSQCSIIPNSCSKGNSLLTAHRILQPRVALEGRAGTACMGDRVLQGLRLQSGPLRRLGGQRTFPGLQTKGGKVHGKQRLQTTSTLLLRSILINPSLRAKPQSLDPPAQPTLQQHQGAAWESWTTRARTAWRAGGQPPSFTLEHQPFPVCCQRGTAQQGGAASPLLQSHAQPR